MLCHLFMFILRTQNIFPYYLKYLCSISERKRPLEHKLRELVFLKLGHNLEYFQCAVLSVGNKVCFVDRERRYLILPGLTP